MKAKKTETPSEEFSRFKEMTKRILAVPKKEIEQEQAKYDQKRTQAKRPAK